MDWLKLATGALATVKEIVTELKSVNASLVAIQTNQEAQLRLLDDIKRRQTTR